MEHPRPIAYLFFGMPFFASGSDSGPECSDYLFAAPLAAAYRSQPIGEASSTVTRVVTDAAAHCPGTANLVRRTIPTRACLRLVSLYFPQSNARKPACTAKLAAQPISITSGFPSGRIGEHVASLRWAHCR